MRQTHAGLAGKMSLALAAALIITLAFAGLAAAMPAAPEEPDFPNLPHFFQGKVTTDKGVTLPGFTVTARAVTGSWTGSATATVDGNSTYGYNPDNLLAVPGYDSTQPGYGAKQGDQIAFFVNGVQALLYDPATQTTSTTYGMIYGGDTVLDLIVPLYYTITPTAGPGCMITPGTPQSVPYKGSQGFTIAANAGYRIFDVKVNGVSQGRISSYTFTNVTSDGTIEATCRYAYFLPLILNN